MLSLAAAVAGFSPTEEPINAGESVTDACVIGAGYAGLSAARELTKAKRSVVLLEASSRIGGRALDHQWPSGAVTELGVEFLGHRSDAPATYKLFVDELKLSIYSHGAFVANATQQFVCRNMRGNVSSVGGKFLPGELLKCGSPEAAAEGVAALAELDLLIAQMDASRPWAHPKAAELDATTWEAWMAKRLGPEALIYVNRGLAPGLSDAPGRVSMLHAVYLGKTGGGLINGLIGGNQDNRVREGGQAAAKLVAAALGPSVVRLGQPVAQIDATDSESVTVRTTGGAAHRCKEVVVTGSPLGVRRIDFAPALPHNFSRLLAAVHQGNSVRLAVVYPTPFWRGMGLSASIGDLFPPSLVYYGYDASPEDSSVGVVEFHLCAEGADALMAMDVAAREKYVTDYMVTLFGANASTPTAILGHDFGGDAFIGGGFQANFPPGVWTTLGPALMRDAPAGDARVHFAGTEWTHAIGGMFYGYVEGAISSGVAAAAAVHARLG